MAEGEGIASHVVCFMLHTCVSSTRLSTGIAGLTLRADTRLEICYTRVSVGNITDHMLAKYVLSLKYELLGHMWLITVVQWVLVAFWNLFSESISVIWFFLLQYIF